MVDTANASLHRQKSYSEITASLKTLIDTANNAYAALYISRIKKDTEDEEDDAVYPKNYAASRNYITGYFQG